MTTGAFYGYYNSKEELFAVLSVLVYIAGLMCSHMAAFRITTNLRIAMTDHIATLPLGQMEQMGSGKLRRTISDTSGAAETYLAHQLPDQAKAYASMMGMAGKNDPVPERSGSHYCHQQQHCANERNPGLPGTERRRKATPLH